MLCPWELASASTVICVCVKNYLRLRPHSFCHLFFLFCFSYSHVPAKQRFHSSFVPPLCSPVAAHQPSRAFGVPLRPPPLGCCWDTVTGRTNLVPPGASTTSAGFCYLSRLARPADGLPKSSKTPATLLHGNEGAKKLFLHRKLGEMSC